jgi:hypothetical protein
VVVATCGRLLAVVMSRQAPFTVTELSDPPRVVIDIANE